MEQIIIDELLAKVKKGDWNAYLEIFLHKKDALYRRAFYITKNHHDADDAMEDSVIKGFHAIKRLEKPSKIYSYLMKIVINSSYDILKKNKRTATIEEPQTIVTGDSNAKASEKLDLHIHLEKLDEDHKTVLILRFFSSIITL